jgi:drug/metabolite transporter (DMT)-like permease
VPAPPDRMTLLLLVSLVWAFSFGLVKRLAGLDPTAVAAVRLGIALAVFLPCFRRGQLGGLAMLRLAAVGALQFGIMYLLYLRAYAHLAAYEVALFTITTPLFVALIDAALERRWRTRYAVAALLSVAGAGVVMWRAIVDAGIVAGFLLVQLSNLCFAGGQVAWRRERRRLPPGASEGSVFALPFAGALLLTVAVSLVGTNWPAFAPTRTQWLILLYLGAVASGLCFFLWNFGASRVNAGTLAAFNNFKIPLGIAASILIFHEHANLGRLALGFALMALGVGTAGRRPDESRTT